MKKNPLSCWCCGDMVLQLVLPSIDADPRPLCKECEEVNLLIRSEAKAWDKEEATA